MNIIHLVCLGVRDMKASIAFYKQIGFQTNETDDAPPVIFFDTQGTKLELYPLDLLAKDISEDNPPPLSRGGFGGVTLAITLKSEQEVDGFMDAVVAAGGTIAKQPQRVFWGGYSGYFQDPDGYYWEVAYSERWAFDENDMLIID
jgi:predicted lactoylglutathione lyase